MIEKGWCPIMSLDKAIEHRKEKRKPYSGSKVIFASCRNHGSCKWCEGGRLYNRKKREDSAKRDLRDYSELSDVRFD